MGSRGFSDHHEGEGKNEAREAGACDLLSQPGIQSPEVTVLWAWSGGGRAERTQKLSWLVSMNLPVRNKMGVANLLPSAKQTPPVEWSGEA